MSGGLEMGTTGTCQNQKQSSGNPREAISAPLGLLLRLLSACCVPVEIRHITSIPKRRGLRLFRDESLEVGTLASKRQCPRSPKPSAKCAQHSAIQCIHAAGSPWLLSSLATVPSHRYRIVCRRMPGARRYNFRCKELNLSRLGLRQWKRVMTSSRTATQ